MTEMASSSPDTTVWVLFVLLALLAVALVLLYKKLNRDSDGQYTIRRMIYMDGGVRDRTRAAVAVLEARLGTRLWPGGEAEESETELQDIGGDVEKGNDRRHSEENGEGSEEEEEQEDHESDAGEASDGGDSDGDDSNSEDVDRGQRVKLLGPKEDGGEVGGAEGGKEEEEKEEKEMEADKLDGVSGGSTEGEECSASVGGLLVDLKQFSGSAIWTEEKKGSQEIETDVTAL